MGFAELFAQRAAIAPDLVAVDFTGPTGATTQTYRELELLTSGMAARLVADGLAPGDRVLVLLRSPRFLAAAALAVWRAGGVYVPVDSRAPDVRIADIATQTAPRVVICDVDPPAGIVPKGTGVLRVDLAEADAASAGPTVPRRPEDPAYVIFTSGSTGQPKGVVVAHRGLTNLVTAQRIVFDTQPGDRVLQFASSAFDASIAELTLALANGSTLVCADRDLIMPGEPLAEFLRAQQVSHAILVPTALAQLPPGDYPRLTLLGSAGEACPPSLAERWRREVRLYNLYGPTECSVWSTYQQVTASLEERVPIGGPIPNATTWVLDEQLRPVPDGVPGELYLGGVGVAIGYLGRPDLTAARFVSAPGDPGARVYRTGDAVRRLPDGGLEFLGRTDNQVKLRGLRIELEEIEARLLGLAGVRQAAAFLDEGEGPAADTAALVAVVVGDGQIDLDELRGLLRQTLPDYMVPRLVALPMLPESLVGKVDRAALRSMVAEHESAVSSVAPPPADPVEQDIAVFVAALLGIPAIGPSDDFYEKGGHSLLVTRLMAHIRDGYGVDIPLGAFYADPTVRTLAAFVTDDQRERSA
ncbi:non-ribosomal peptide synthetase [Nocardia sp. NPDC049190]|uniref:non-ribosomal peptide synthetase n=1 Tax=Nocardia sp. NPDC049190 TaxID=3155650 RepID=UPI0033F0C7AC